MKCKRCQAEFERTSRYGPTPLYCSACNPSVRRAWQKADQKRQNPGAFSAQQAKYRKTYAAAHPDKQRQVYRRYNLKRLYGMSEAEYDALLSSQSGGCAICGTAEPGGRGDCFKVDHDHVTGMVRALLCHGCNLGIGMFRDDPELLEEAASYLRAHGALRLVKETA
jgi:hypothetical protein